MDKNISAAYTDALLRLAVVENHKRELEAIPSREELEKMYSFSPEHEARMKKLFIKESRDKRRKNPFKVLRQVAAAIIILFALFFGILLTNTEVRAAVWETVVVWYTGFTRFVFNSDETATGDARWHLSYLPEGFSETNFETVGGYTYIDYSDSLGQSIALQYKIAGGAIAVDNEHSEHTTVTEHGVEYHIFKSKSEEYPSIIIWERDGYSFMLQATFISDELLRMAFSVGQ